MPLQLQATATVWRPIAGHPGYRVSDTGLVESPEGLVEPTIRADGVLAVALPGAPGSSSVATLVLRTFDGLPDNYRVHHRNENRADCRLSNLYSVSRQGHNRGTSHVKAVLTAAQVEAIHNRSRVGESIAQIARDLGVNYYTAYSVASGRTWARTSIAKRSPAHLTHEQVRQIRFAIEDGQTYPSIAKQHGVTTSAVQAIASGKTWKNVT